ncbi:MAG: hypothetical protein JNK64_24040 [Myxococcales bacterium]|nr:hypothetical protein [Myxococcales bacterium]
MTRWLVALALALVATAAPAGAQPAARPVPAVQPVADIGAVAAGATPGVWLVTTDAADAAYAFGRAALVTGLRGPFTLALRWRRLDADVSACEVWLPSGGVILLRDGELALWDDNATFAGFQPLPGLRTQRTTAIEVRQGDATLELWVDGARVGRWPRGPGPAAGALAVAIKAPPRRRARLRISDVAFRQGQ